jgi:hypothetical protein
MEGNHRLADRGGHRTGRVGEEHRRGDRGGEQEEVRHGHKARDKDTVKKGHNMKCPRDNCDYNTATQPAAYRSQQMELQLLRAHAVVVHIVGIENIVFGCTHCGERHYPLSVTCSGDSAEMQRRCSGDAAEMQRRCSFHDKSCVGDIMSLGPGRRVRLEEWVMHLRIMAAAKGLMKIADVAQVGQIQHQVQKQVGPEKQQQLQPQHGHEQQPSWQRFKRKPQKDRKLSAGVRQEPVEQEVMEKNTKVKLPPDLPVQKTVSKSLTGSGTGPRGRYINT